MSNAVSERNVVSVLMRLLQAGDLDTAVDLYEERGRSIAEQLFVKLQFTEGALPMGAKMYEQARDFVRAARLHEHARHWPDAARLWEEAGELAASGRAWKKAGDLEKAAAALQAGGELEEAQEIYAGLKQLFQQATVLARRERWLDSAAAYRLAGNTRAETDALRAVPLAHPERVPAVKRLAEILVVRNRAEEAAQLVAEAVQENELGRADAELHELLAALFDRLGQRVQAERVRFRAQRLRAREAAPAAAESEYEASEPKPEPEGGYRFLKRIPIFARLSLEDMRDLYRLTTEETWKPGQPIIDVGVDAPGLIVIIEGDAEVYALAADGHRHLNSVGPGAHLGEISLLSNSLTSALVTAGTLVRGLRLSKDAFEQFIAAHPMAALRIYRLFSEKLAERVRALSVG